MTIIKLSAKGLSDFIVRGPAAKESTIRNYKYPKDKGPMGRMIYSEPFFTAIKEFLRNSKEPDWLIARSMELQIEAERMPSGNTKEKWYKSRQVGNARALSRFTEHFSDLTCDIQRIRKGFNIQFQNVLVSAEPDLICKDAENLKFLKFHFAKEPPKLKAPRYICQVMYEAAVQAGYICDIKNFFYLDLERGQSHSFKALSPVAQRDIEAACRMIGTMWESILPQP